MWLGFLSGRQGSASTYRIIVKVRSFWEFSAGTLDCWKHSIGFLRNAHILKNCSLYCCLLDLPEPWASHWPLFEHALFKMHPCRTKGEMWPGHIYLHFGFKVKGAREHLQDLLLFSGQELVRNVELVICYVNCVLYNCLFYSCISRGQSYFSCFKQVQLRVNRSSHWYLGSSSVLFRIIGKKSQKLFSVKEESPFGSVACF